MWCGEKRGSDWESGENAPFVAKSEKHRGKKYSSAGVTTLLSVAWSASLGPIRQHLQLATTAQATAAARSGRDALLAVAAP